MKLCYSRLSTYCHKVMIAFNEKGIAYEPELVDLMSAEGRAAFEKIYPIGRVPFLKPSEDWQVPESTSIIEYLEGKFPNTPRLIPASEGDAARQVRFMDRMADRAAIPALFYAQTVMPFDAYPNIIAYWQRALKRPSYAKVKAELEPIWQGLISQHSAA